MELLVDGQAALTAMREPGIKGGVDRIRLGGSLADKAAERALNEAYFACGCTEGSVAVLVALIASLALGLLNGFDGVLTWWCIALYLAGSALAGKLVGISRARVRLNRLYRLLEERVRAYEQTD